MSPSRRCLEYLPRLLSKWGACSRKEAERLVIAGRVTVNGVVRRHVLDEVHPGRDRIELDGRLVQPAQHLWLKLHKPVGVVTTMKDPEGRPTVAALVPERFRGVMPVGRLDRDSSGLLLLTNDHALGHRIAGPNHHVKKIYLVEVNQHPDDGVLDPIRAGIELDGGERCRSAEVRILERRPRSTLLEFTIDEGRFRQIRRSLKAVGLRVNLLHRVRVGPLELGALAPGECAPLTERELAALRDLCGRNASAGS
jgi:23S rRNA pseudouridine2605 synthase